jgi:hypothetical protein
VSTLEIILLIVGVLVVVLAIGGYIAVRRRMEAGDHEFRAILEQANADLAQAHAADHGWDPARLDEAARAAFAERTPDEEINKLELVQVVDKPGTEEDEAVFHVETDLGIHTIRLARRGDEWIPR